MADPSSADGSRSRWLPRIAWTGASLLFAAVAISAVNRLADRLGVTAGQLDQRQTIAGLVAVVLYLVVAIAWLIGIGFVARRRGPGTVLLLGLAATLAVRLGFVAGIDAPLVSDWLAYHSQAVEFARSGPVFGDRPIGYPLLLGGLYAVTGPQVAVAEGLNVAMGMLTGAMLFDLLRRSGGPFVAACGIGLYALVPSLAFITPVVSTEATYTALLMLAIWCLVAIPDIRPAWRHGALAGALGAGLALGFSQYVRPVSFVLLPAFVVVAMVLAWHGTPRRVAGCLVLAFGLVLVPAIIDNAVRHGTLSVETSSYGGFGIYVGTNVEAQGRFNEADAERFADLPGETVRDRSEAAGRLGLQRITADPGAFTGLALRKFVGMWGDDAYGVFFGLEWQADPPPAAGLLVAGYVASAVAWAFVTIAALWGVLRAGVGLPTWLLAGFLVAASLAMLHTVVEVQPRYHAPVTPIWIGAAAMALARWRAATRERGAADPLTR